MRRFEEKLPMNLISMQRLGLLTIRNRSVAINATRRSGGFAGKRHGGR